MTQFPDGQNGFFALREKRWLSEDTKAYLTMDPLIPLGELEDVPKIRRFINRRKDNLAHGVLDRYDPLEINAAAWAALELGYSQNSDSNLSATQQRTVLGRSTSLAGSFFKTLIGYAEDKDSLYDDGETYYAALGNSALRFVWANPRDAAAKTKLRNRQSHYEVTVACLALSHEHLKRANNRDEEVVFKHLAGLRAQLLGMVCVMRRDKCRSDQPYFLALPPSTRHRMPFRQVGETRNHWNVSIWPMPSETLQDFDLGMPAGLKWRIGNRQQNSKNDGNSVTSLSISEQITHTVSEREINLMIQAALQELEKNNDSTEPEGLALLDASARRAQNLVLEALSSPTPGK